MFNENVNETSGIEFLYTIFLRITIRLCIYLYSDITMSVLLITFIRGRLKMSTQNVDFEIVDSKMSTLGICQKWLSRNSKMSKMNLLTLGKY